jgi:hypothetical protein
VTRGLAEFLPARIAEDEAAARALLDDLTAQLAYGYYPPDEHGTFTPQRLLRAEMWAQYAGQSRWRNFARGQHIARLAAPARVLAECEAKRRIVDNMAAYVAIVPSHPIADVALHTLRVLALPYADHPDYDEAWRP